MLLRGAVPSCGTLRRGTRLSARLTVPPHRAATPRSRGRLHVVSLINGAAHSDRCFHLLTRVPVDFGPGTVLGCLLIASGIALYQVRTVRPEVSRDSDVFFSSIGLLCGGILVFQGWRLDPLLFFGQLLTAVTAVSFAAEAVKLRGEAGGEAAGRAPRGGRGGGGSGSAAEDDADGADEASPSADSRVGAAAPPAAAGPGREGRAKRLPPRGSVYNRATSRWEAPLSERPWWSEIIRTGGLLDLGGSEEEGEDVEVAARGGRDARPQARRRGAAPAPPPPPGAAQAAAAEAAAASFRNAFEREAARPGEAEWGNKLRDWE